MRQVRGRGSGTQILLLFRRRKPLEDQAVD